MSLKCKPHFTLFITMYMQCCTLYTTIHAVLFTYAVHVRSRACSTVHMLKYKCMQCCASSFNAVLYMQCCTHAVQVNGFWLYKYIPCSTRTCSDVHMLTVLYKYLQCCVQVLYMQCCINAVQVRAVHYVCSTCSVVYKFMQCICCAIHPCCLSLCVKHIILR